MKRLNHKKNYFICISIFLLLLMKMSYASKEVQNSICTESSLRQFQKDAEKIVQNTKNPYESQVKAFLSLKPIITENCLKLDSTNKNKAPEDLNSAIAYVDTINQAAFHIISLHELFYDSYREKHDYSKLTESDIYYLDYYLAEDSGEGGCFSVFYPIMMQEYSIPKWIPTDRQAKIRKYLPWCYKFSHPIKRNYYWFETIKSRFTDQKQCPFVKDEWAVLVDENLCISFHNYDYDLLKEEYSDESNDFSRHLNCSGNPLQKGCPYLEVISKERGKVKKIKFPPDVDSVLSDVTSACGLGEIRVDPKTKQFILFGSVSGDCFGGSGFSEVGEIYEIKQLKPIIVRINSTTGHHIYEEELEGFKNEY